MADSILSTFRLSHNEVSKLAQIFEALFEYYSTNNSPFAEDYLREIKTIVGLGLTAVLVDSSFLTIYHNKFNSFMQYMDFKKHTGALSVLSLNIAEMVDLSSYVFRIIQYPGYYKDFSIALRKALTRMGAQLAGKSEEAEKLLQIILQP